uniref:Uncharacterized protein n=1 Tax=Myoviridae sp. ctGjZ5 TaxID=2826634 RepID=A0A8S5MSU6_9CAUD|nr:MAG TPA: hypothetical protein [Myoviridae sp. ctGjZ5]DAP06141.1 MAG TPA: hypothetical protein [Caudoviricetes sp.]
MGERAARHPGKPDAGKRTSGGHSTPFSRQK